MGKRGCLLLMLAACGSKSGGNPDAPISTGSDAAVDAPAIDAMVSIDAPVLDFSCVTNPPPASASDPIVISGGIAELTLSGMTPTIAALDGATVTGCKPGQTNCGSAPAQFGSATTPTTAGMPGTYALTNVVTGGNAYDAYLRVTKQGDRQTFSWPIDPYSADTSHGVIVFNSNAFALITIGLGVTQSAQKGDLGLIVADCANQPITDTTNLSFAITQGGQAVQGTTTFDVGSVNSAAKGSYFIFNVPGGANGNLTATDIVVTYSGVTPPVVYRTRTLGVAASSTSQTIVHPGYM